MTEQEVQDVEKIVVNENNIGIEKIYGLVHLVVGLYAVFLSFKCNKGFNLGHLVLALLFPWFYILYHLAVNEGC
jgi:hypothetical protein